MLSGVPPPVPDLDTQPFWDGCEQGRFLLPKCRSCGYVRWPPGPMCPDCQSMEIDWIEAKGGGAVYSWIVAHHPVLPALVDQVPYVIAMIDLDEGARVVGNVLECPWDEVEAGMRVETIFERTNDGVTIPNFRKSKT
jgi:uncharacterized protein